MRRCLPDPPTCSAPRSHLFYLADLRPPALGGGITLIYIYVYILPPATATATNPQRCLLSSLFRARSGTAVLRAPPPTSLWWRHLGKTSQDMHTVGYHDICPPAVFAPVMVRYNSDRKCIPSDKYVSHIVLRARPGHAVFRAPPPPILCDGVTSEYNPV